MSNKVASLYAEIGLDTSEAERGLGETKRGFKENQTAAERLERQIGRLAQQDFAAREARAAKVAYDKLSESDKALARSAANLADAKARQAIETEKAARAAAKERESTGPGHWTELKSQIDIATGAVQKFAETAKAIYDFGKAGAELEYSAIKFDRLSAAIGTTSDALLRDLRTATKGTLSDMELMASAADLAGLGLAKSHTQVVRLSKVVGGLGMDMNQLVLTLANQTTMRFDQLGVSVDGFDEKVKALKESGMDANAAFTEAFLQQAEQQLEKVGNKADENIGKFQRFEASLANAGNTIKTNTAPAMANLADAMAKLLDNFSKRRVMEGLADSLGGMSGAQRDAFIQAGIALDGLTESEERAREAAERNARAQIESADALTTVSETAEENKGKNTDLLNLTERSGDAWDRFQDRVDATNQRLEESRDAMEAAKEAGQKLADAEANWKENAGGDIAGMLADRVGTGSKYEEALKAIDEVMGTNLLTEEQLKDQQKALVDEFARTGDLDKFREGMKKTTEVFMPLDESVRSSTLLMQELNEELARFEGAHYASVHMNVVDNTGGALAPSGPASSGSTSTSATSQTTTNKPNSNKPNQVRREASGGAVFPGSTVMMNESRATGTGQPEVFVSSGGGHVLTRQQAQDAVAGQVGGGISIGNVNLYGVQDVQSFLAELGEYVDMATKSGAYTAGMRG